MKKDLITKNDYLYLDSVTFNHIDFFKGTFFFDGILSKVLSIHKIKEYTLYKTPFEFIAQKGKYTAYGKTIKKTIADLEFKFNN